MGRAKMYGEIYQQSDACFYWTFPYTIYVHRGESYNHIAFSPQFQCEGQKWYFQLYRSEEMIHFSISKCDPIPSVHSYKLQIKNLDSGVYWTSSLLTQEFGSDKLVGDIQSVREFQLLRDECRMASNNFFLLQVTFHESRDPILHPQGTDSTAASCADKDEEEQTCANVQEPDSTVFNSNGTNSTEANFGTTDSGEQICFDSKQQETSPINSNATISTEAISGTANAGWETCSDVQQPERPPFNENGTHSLEASWKAAETGEQTCCCKAQHPENAPPRELMSFGELFAREEQTDVTLNVKGTYFNVHKAILAAESPVFKNMFGPGKVEQSPDYVQIYDCNPEPFHVFLNYLYTRRTVIKSDDIFFEMYVISKKYGVEHLADKCVNFMISHLCVEYFCDIVILALKHKEVGLLECTKYFFTRNMDAIASRNDWHNFILRYPDDYQNFLSNDLN